MASPPGVSREDFADAIKDFERVVGKKWVFTSDEDVALYRDAYSPFWGEPEERVASAAVAPDSLEEVRAIVKIANAYGIPIYPISTGRNLGYGGSAPVLSGSVVLDLKRMNRILEVSERNAYALVEPGVSYFDLYRYIRKNKLKLWIDVPDPGWGSLVGNTLEHGAGHMAFRDHLASHCGMEVVLANGDVVRTGMGALPGAKTWQQFQYGYGPYLDGLFSQSNYGVVTKMGFWLLAEPEAYRMGTVKVSRYDGFVPLVDVMNYLTYSGAFNASTNFTSPVLSNMSGDPGLAALLSRHAGAAQLEDYAITKNIPYWTSDLRFYGPAKVIEAQWEYAKEKFSAAIPDATFEDGLSLRFPLTDEEAEKVIGPVWVGIPSLSVFAFGARSPTNATPTNGHIWFSPVIPMTGDATFKARSVFSRAFKVWGVQPLESFLPQSYQPRTFLLLYGFAITRDIETNKKNRETMRRMIKLAAEHGWGEYRTAPAFMDDCAEVYSFNDHALTRLHETIKDALDPNGILSAGRYGIWPKQLRKTRA